MHAGMESYKAVEMILEQLRPFLVHAKRKDKLRIMQKSFLTLTILIVA